MHESQCVIFFTITFIDNNSFSYINRVAGSSIEDRIEPKPSPIRLLDDPQTVVEQVFSAPK